MNVKIGICASSSQEATILGSVAKLNEVHQEMLAFLSSHRNALSLELTPVVCRRGASLKMMSVLKTSGPIVVTLLADGVLQLAGDPENLKVYCEFFWFDESDSVGDHHHPEYVDTPGYWSPQSLSVVIQVDE